MASIPESAHVIGVDPMTLRADLASDSDYETFVLVPRSRPDGRRQLSIIKLAMWRHGDGYEAALPEMHRRLTEYRARRRERIAS